MSLFSSTAVKFQMYGPYVGIIRIIMYEYFVDRIMIYLCETRWPRGQIRWPSGERFSANTMLADTTKPKISIFVLLNIVLSILNNA